MLLYGLDRDGLAFVFLYLYHALNHASIGLLLHIIGRLLRLGPRLLQLAKLHKDECVPPYSMNDTMGLPMPAHHSKLFKLFKHRD